MPHPYQVWLRQPCLDYLATLGNPARTKLIAWIEGLGHDVSREGDYNVRGTEDRDWHVSILGPHAVVWWVDHPAREIKIVAIRAADR